MQRRYIIGFAPLVGVLGLLIATGCTSDEEKMKTVLAPRLAKCIGAEGTFADLPDATGGNKKVFVAGCKEELTGVKRVDEFKGEAKTGPYTWHFGVDDLGTWMVTDITWKTFEDGRKAIEAVDPSEEEYARGLDLLTKAHEEWPKSPWIAIKRVETALKLRKKRGPGDESPLLVGKQVEAILADTVNWGKSNGNEAVAKTAEALVASYYEKQRRLHVDALKDFGSSDDWLINSIALAEREKNKEDVEKYKKELEERKAERPVKIKEARQKVFEVTLETCKHYQAAQEITAEDLLDEGLPKASELLEGIQAKVCEPGELEKLKTAINEPVAAE